MDDETKAIYQSVGRFFCSFSNVEHELGEALKVIFKIQRLGNADVIVACLGDLTRKLNVVWSGVAQARQVDGAEPDPQWKSAAEKTMKRILAINENDRVVLAHSRLEPLASGNLQLTRMTSKGELKIKVHEWSVGEMERKCNELDDLAEQVRKLRSDLSTYTYNVDLPANLELFVPNASPSAGSAPVST